MPFEEFQRIALYDPEDGFFGSGKLRSTKEGDFLTSPEVSPLFGETLAKFVDQFLSSPSGGSGRGEERAGVDGGGAEVGGRVPTLVEVGSGSGSLLRPLLVALEHSVDAWVVEASPAARAALAEMLPADRVVSSLDEVAAPFSGVVLANELLDNLPVAVAVRTGIGWEERWVGIEDGHLVLVPHPARPEVAAWANRFGLPCPEGGRVEVQLAAADWMRRALDVLARGAVVVIDYGEKAEHLEHRRLEGTLRTYRAHHLGPHPPAVPGETDITNDVNFSSLCAVAEAAGASVELHRQDEFLESLGLAERIRELREQELALARDGDPMERLKARSDRTNAETLLHPRGLGDFRVLIARK
ncbi:MAG: hypothetical protein GWP04_07150 [Gammaproteobacteria bacterium]|nr:hypothetical protein [Gammaproteobacteria bacterium]